MKLISMTDFVLEQSKKIMNCELTHLESHHQIVDYANFLKQPLKLEMFVPCDENGKLIITIEDLLNTNTNTMSKEFKGTQGQWVLEKDGNSAFFINSTEREEIVSVWIEDDETEAKANAKLISKAPEMLEALQFFVNNNMLSVIGEEVAERLINEILE